MLCVFYNTRVRIYIFIYVCLRACVGVTMAAGWTDTACDCNNVRVGLSDHRRRRPNARIALGA